MTMRVARDDAEIEAAKRLRLRVFCEEQGVSPEEELDGLDDDAVHIVGLDESGVIATCRLRFVEDGTCKLERMAIDQRLRGQGVGAKLLGSAEDEARQRSASTMVLNAQRRAEGFYAANGYLAEGGTFMSAEIEHVRMTKEI